MPCDLVNEKASVSNRQTRPLTYRLPPFFIALYMQTHFHTLRPFLLKWSEFSRSHCSRVICWVSMQLAFLTVLSTQFFTPPIERCPRLKDHCYCYALAFRHKYAQGFLSTELGQVCTRPPAFVGETIMPNSIRVKSLPSIFILSRRPFRAEYIGFPAY